MSPILFFLGLGLFLVLVVFPIWAIVRILSLGNANEDLRQRLEVQEAELRALRTRTEARTQRQAPPDRSSLAEASLPSSPPVVAPASPPPVVVAEPETPATPAPIPVIPAAAPAPEPRVAAEAPPPAPEILPPPLPAPRAEQPSVGPPAEEFPAPLPEPVPLAAGATEYNPPPRFNWEQFMGAKLFAWLGGLAGLLAVGFFVKYSFEHDLVPPEVRVAIGFLFAVGLVIGGLKIDRARFAVTAQTLIATGVVSLYTVTFACRSVYHFSFFGVIPTFLLMALITGTAFLLAVRLEAQVVAILGMLGGFLTPVLVSTGQDNPLGLFGYIALLDAGLVAVALHRRWSYLVPLGAAGTIAMQIGWAVKFFTDERAPTATLVFLAFSALFLGATIYARRREVSSRELTWSAVALAGVGYGFALFFLDYPAIAARVAPVFAVVLAANVFLLALAWFEGLGVLVGLAGAGTTVLLIKWLAEAVTPALAPTAMGVCLGFCAFFLAAHFLARRLGRAANEIAWAAVALPCVALVFAFSFLEQPEIGARPGLLFTFVLMADLCLLAIAWCEEKWPRLHLVAGAAVFVLLSVWTGLRLTPALLPWGLVFCLVYAALHTVFPLLLERHRAVAVPAWWSQVIPPLALLVLLIPLFRLEELSLLFWPVVLLVDLLAIGLALLTSSLAAVGAVLMLTLVATGVWVLRIPVAVSAAPALLFVIGGFAVLFFAAGFFLVRRLGERLAAERSGWLPAGFGDPRAQIPALSALLPFVLLIMMTARLPLANPSPVFGLALLLVVLVLGLTVILMGPGASGGAGDGGPASGGAGPDRGQDLQARGKGSAASNGHQAGIEWLPACALAGVAGLEYSWRARHFAVDFATIPLLWYLGFYAIFVAYPFVFRRRLAGSTGPWAVAAVAGVAQFPLVYRLVMAAWPNPVPGVLPTLFAVAPLASLAAVLRGPAVAERVRLNQLAVFGGVALLFLTLVFPIQFERQWLTLGWALEGVALLWLFHRVPHPGLRVVGVALLVTAFARLALNPAVFAYHARSSAPILNWYLYSYGLVTACLFAGAHLLAPPRERVFRLHAPALLHTLGTVLAFLLLNIEIADFFSQPGERVLTFRFSGHFGRDMTYTIAWSLFALGLLLVSFWKRLRPGRYAALALLGVAVLKLFFHDLARLGALHRIGALFAVAVIATLASFAYQRFLPADDHRAPPKP